MLLNWFGGKQVEVDEGNATKYRNEEERRWNIEDRIRSNLQVNYNLQAEVEEYYIIAIDTCYVQTTPPKLYIVWWYKTWSILYKFVNWIIMELRLPP